MKIERIKMNSVVWGHGKGGGKYSDIWDIVRKMPLNTAIKITLDEPNKGFNCTVTQTFRIDRTESKFKIRCSRQDREGKIWALKKLALKGA